MRKKRLMLLGGIRYLLPVIQTAHELGFHVITADYLPNNIAHQISDEYVNVNITDKKAVLKKAYEYRIDGIMSFGVDPGVITAAYVQSKMNLPSIGPFDSVCVLQNKDLFRAFLKSHHFNVPRAISYSSSIEALKDAGLWVYPVIIKPTDSAGSKGVSKITHPLSAESAIEEAFHHSLSGRIIVEEFLSKNGYSSDSDCFLQDGRLQFVSFSSQRFDNNAINPFTPAAYSWPSSFTKHQEQYLTQELQRLLSLLKMKSGIYNIETMISSEGKPYLMEVSPRGGGNRLAEMIRYSTGVDLIKASIQAAMGETIELTPYYPSQGYWAELILHSNKNGQFESLEVSDSFPGEIVESDIWVSRGDHIQSFSGANQAIGTMVLHFAQKETMDFVLEDPWKWISLKYTAL